VPGGRKRGRHVTRSKGLSKTRDKIQGAVKDNSAGNGAWREEESGRHVTRSKRLSKTVLQGTVPGGRKRGRQRKRWEDNIQEWTG
jgi:hypothetical protein